MTGSNDAVPNCSAGGLISPFVPCVPQLLAA